MSFLMACGLGLTIGRLAVPRSVEAPGARLVQLAWAAAALQLSVSLLSREVRDVLAAPLLMTTFVMIGVFLGVNARAGRFHNSARIAMVGWLLNAAVVLANGAMPVDLRAASTAGIEVDDASNGFLFEHENLHEGTRLRWLADVIPVHFGPERSVQSIGDVLLLGGVGLAVATAARRRPDVALMTRREVHS